MFLLYIYLFFFVCLYLTVNLNVWTVCVCLSILLWLIFYKAVYASGESLYVFSIHPSAELWLQPGVMMKWWLSLVNVVHRLVVYDFTKRWSQCFIWRLTAVDPVTMLREHHHHDAENEVKHTHISYDKNRNFCLDSNFTFFTPSPRTSIISTSFTLHAIRVWSALLPQLKSVELVLRSTSHYSVCSINLESISFILYACYAPPVNFHELGSPVDW